MTSSRHIMLHKFTAGRVTRTTLQAEPVPWSHELADTKVYDFNHKPLASTASSSGGRNDKDVVKLNVPVAHPPRVHMHQRVYDLHENTARHILPQTLCKASARRR